MPCTPTPCLSTSHSPLSPALCAHVLLPSHFHTREKGRGVEARAHTPRGPGRELT